MGSSQRGEVTLPWSAVCIIMGIHIGQNGALGDAGSVGEHEQ